MANQRAFNIGISMAGAVSGGAYSAGVFDFLMEALNEWTKAKDRGDLVPDHSVYISALSGTSAGGITAALGIAALAAGVRDVEAPSLNPNNKGAVRRALPELYDIWVKKVRLFRSSSGSGAADQAPCLLDVGDATPERAPLSLLNSDVLTQIARDALRDIRPAGVKYPFFTNPTHLFLTHTNLDGVPYPIDFTRDEYSMMMHEGRMHFAVTGLGTVPFPKECTWLEKWGDTGVTLDVSEFGDIGGNRGGELKEPFEALAQAALTTSAFPFGFSGRRIAVDRTKLHSSAMPFDPGKFPEELNKREKAMLPFYMAERNAHFVCVDGGAMNNEPFEVVRWTIKSSDETHNVRDGTKADRAVILIAPFPPQASFDAEKVYNPNRDVGLRSIGLSLFPALVNQARFKASDLIAAADENVYSRFLISPSRNVPPSGQEEIPALASNELYAFAGFIDERFREHDFQLGRRNCQWFLRKHFTLKRANPLFGGPNAESRFSSVEDPEHPHPDGEWPIIPLVGSAAKEVALLDWPILPRSTLKSLKTALQARMDLLAASFTTQLLHKYPSLRMAARLSWWRHRREITNKMVGFTARSLEKQLEAAPASRLTHWLMEVAHLVPRLLIIGAIAAACYALYDWSFNWGWTRP
jgi:hypothetical protein